MLEHPAEPTNLRAATKEEEQRDLT